MVKYIILTLFIRFLRLWLHDYEIKLTAFDLDLGDSN